MYTLYYSAGACSMAIHAALNELNVPFKAVSVSIQEGENRKPEYLKINPMGTVPALKLDDGTLIREGAAILITLFEKHKSPLFPLSGPEHTKALEWLMFCNATLHPSYGAMFFLGGFAKEGDKATMEKLTAAAMERLNKRLEFAEAQLAKTPYLCGKECSIADILLTVIANWSGYFAKPVTYGPNVRRVLKEVSNRPAFKKTLAAEGVEYKAAA